MEMQVITIIGTLQMAYSLYAHRQACSEICVQQPPTPGEALPRAPQSPAYRNTVWPSGNHQRPHRLLSHLARTRSGNLRTPLPWPAEESLSRRSISEQAHSKDFWCIDSAKNCKSNNSCKSGFSSTTTAQREARMEPAASSLCGACRMG